MKKMIVLAIAVVAGLCVGEAAEINMGFFKFKRQNAKQVLQLQDGTILATLIPQIHIPDGKRYKWGNFTYPKSAKVVRHENVLELSNTGFYKKKSGQHGVKLNADIELTYRMSFATDGKVKAHYEFTNHGDDAFLEPYCNVKVNRKLIEHQEAKLYRANEVVETRKIGKDGNTSSIDYRGGNPKDPQLVKLVVNTALGQPVVLETTAQGHIRLNRGGEITVYDHNHFAGHIWRKPLQWKRFAKGETFVVDFVLQLPRGKYVAPKVLPQVAVKKKAVKKSATKEPIEKTLPVLSGSVEPVDCFKYEDVNRAQRAVIKNGTFYRDGKPVFFVGPWLSSHFFDYEKKIPVPEFKDMPSHNQIFNAEIAEEMGFNTCHPQVTGIDTLKRVGVFERYPHHIKIWTKYLEKMIRGFKNMPLVMDYANMGWRFDHPWRKWFKAEMFQANTQWHGFVPFCLAHPSAWKVHVAYWQEGARKYLKYGANPWIYELFNEPAYDSRDPLTQKLFIEFLKKKYKNLDELNREWQSNFKSFEEIVADPVVERQKGLQVEWFKFIGDHWAEILKKGKQAIREIDKRPNIYFSTQRGTSGSFLTTRNGYDEYKIARAVDVVNTEGGLTFSFGKMKKSDNPMDEYINTHMNMHLDMCRAAAEGKPVIDTEQSTRRYSAAGRRIPSQRSDLRLMLWNEAIHGSSMSLLYNWGKRSWQWKPFNLKGAEAFVNKPAHGWAAGCLLNPYCYPKDALGGIKEFEGKIKELAEIVLPNPRIKGKVALLLSNPSRCYNGSIEAEFSLVYQAATSTNMPKDVIFEEQLTKGLAEQYQAIVSPYCRYSYKATLPALEKYVKAGGVVVLNGMDLESDEYGKPIAGDAFMGLAKRRQLDMPVPVMVDLKLAREAGYPTGAIAAKMGVVPTPADAKVIASTEERNLPVITMKTLGKGRIYYIACELNKGSWTTVLTSIFKDAGIKNTFMVRSEDEQLLPAVEAQVIDRGSKRLYYFANWNFLSEMGRVMISDIDSGNWTVALANSNVKLTSPAGNKSWSAAELQKGMPVFFPGWDAQLLLIEKDGDTAGNYVTIARMKAEYQQRRISDEKQAVEAQGELKRHRDREWALNNYVGVKPENCVMIDISAQCNMAFRDDVNGDKKGGTSDQGDNDLRTLPVGRQVLAGVPFHVLDPAKNNGKSMITLRSKERPYFPERVDGIPVNNKFNALYFLHAQLWGSKEAEYIVHYADGSTSVIPVVAGENIRGWWQPRRPKQGKIAWQGKNGQAKIGIYCWKWVNPNPGKEIKSIDVKTNGMLLGTIAITGEK